MTFARIPDSCAQCECGDHFWSRMNKWGVALVSPEDAAWLKEYHFTLARGKRHSYCQSSRLSADFGTALLHIVLCDGKIVDHKNSNGLDNRRLNLRPATQSQNNMNMRKRRGATSVYKGVSWRSERGKWRACLSENGKQTFLGHFPSESAAAAAYDAAAKVRFGAFAKLNFPI